MPAEDPQAYLELIRRLFEQVYEVASRARARGLDPEPFVEIKPAYDLAERVEGLIGLRGVAARIRELAEKEEREIVAFRIAEDIVKGRFGDFPEEERAELALRTALAVLTEGITAAPIQGIDRVAIKRNPDGSRYLAIYYAGPIRSAGGTEQALSVLLGDYIRQLLGLDRYKPTKEEIDRYIEELRLYERAVSRFQYHATDEEIRYVVEHLPIEVTGVATDPVEVTIHRDLPRVETNCVRGGALRVINDGIIAKARKLKPIIEKLGISGWEWLDKLIKSEGSGSEGQGIEPSDKYLADVVAGRPILAHPSRPGGFRIRYGRSRNTGLAAIGMHPATMIVLGGFIAVGTQVRTERPGKSAVILPVDTIEGPVVKLKDGSVIRVEDIETAKRVADEIEEIIFVGDILVAYGEFKENNYPLVPSGYCEEWWALEARRALDKLYNGTLFPKLPLPAERLQQLLENPLRVKPTAAEAIKISESLRIPLHPRYTYFWSQVKLEDAKRLRRELLSKAKVIRDEEGFARRIEIRGLSPEAKRTLELLGIPHIVSDGVIIIEDDAAAVDRLFALDTRAPDPNHHVSSVREYFELLSGLRLRDKVTIATGLRMGRPEKAAPREMSPPVHALFPVGEQGGRGRSLEEALERGFIVVDVAFRKCPKCGRMTFEYRCPSCGSRTVLIKACPVCGRELHNGKCPRCGVPPSTHGIRRIDIRAYVEEIRRRYGVKFTEVKCVKGLMSQHREPEPLVKGMLRAKYGLFVFKDGTIRFDATNAPLTHFRPREIGVSVSKLRELGYDRDCFGRPLERDDQIVELKIHDIVIPRKAAEYLLRVAKFVDELLEKVYGLEPFYRAEKPEDLIGHLVIGIAPHTSAGVVGRIIGFTEANVIFAHPYWHAAKRRNCDGDEDAIILALDALLNFSRHYLPRQRGGMMDAPLVVTVTIDPREVDDEVHNMDVHWGYDLRFYEETRRSPSPKEVKPLVETVEDRLGRPEAYYGIGFTHDTSRIDAGPLVTAYRKLRTMSEKVRAQLKLAEMVLAVDARDTAERILSHHLIPDVVGNLRAFSAQRFRCTKCNATFRRAPLTPRCPKCGGRLVTTVHQRSVEKYLSSIEELAERYAVSEYLRLRIKLLNSMLRSLFKKRPEEELEAFMEARA